VSPRLRKALALFGRLPGVGEKTAHRYVLHLLTASGDLASELGRAVLELPTHFAPCSSCGNIAELAGATSAQCAICTDHKRDAKLLCVVARVTDLMAFEKPGTYRGVYFVLSGLLSPLEGIGPDALPIAQLLKRIQSEQIREVILATPATVDGEATALFLRREMQALDVTVSRIASGIPHGGDIEFIDSVTLGRALEGRKTL
jgi:recombination protein RecR